MERRDVRLSLKLRYDRLDSSGCVLQVTLSVEQRLTDISVGKDSNLFRHRRRNRPTARKKSRQGVHARPGHLERLEATLETLLQLVEVAVTGADDGSVLRQVIKQGQEANLSNHRDFIRLINPDETIGAEEFPEV